MGGLFPESVMEGEGCCNVRRRKLKGSCSGALSCVKASIVSRPPLLSRPLSYHMSCRLRAMGPN